MTPQDFKERLAGLGWKQADLARATGMTPASVSGWAHGHVPIPDWVASYLSMAETLQAIVQAFRDEPRSRVMALAEQHLNGALRGRIEPPRQQDGASVLVPG